MKRIFLKDIFCTTLIKIRGANSQDEYAPTLGISSSALSQYEGGELLPTSELLDRVAGIANIKLDNFFEETEQNETLLYLCGKVVDDDKEKINTLIDIIRIKDKYKALERRVLADG